MNKKDALIYYTSDIMLHQFRRRKRKKNCSNCVYHDYDEYCCGDNDYMEFEICRKGYDLDDGPCKDWSEL